MKKSKTAVVIDPNSARPDFIRTGTLHKVCISRIKQLLSESIILAELGLKYPEIKEADVPLLASSVNPVRLKNSPYLFKTEDFVEMYSKFIQKKKRRGLFYREASAAFIICFCLYSGDS